MHPVCIGIHVHAEPERLLATLASLRAHTSRAVQTLLLPDGPDAPTAGMLAALHGLPQLGTSRPLGPPACFNRLAAATDAPILVLLESGALVGPGWLDYLLAALAADPGAGLAGPSTNRAWNEQGVFPNADGAPAEIERTAREASQRFGAAARRLAPLHSLADFCYLVRREVVAAIGAADEGYGLGPCWEMDYNIRAARAGFAGVWAGAAYVYRSPFTARRQREEALRFEAGKRRYQDAVCGLRLRGERTEYEPHCRGDACEHFAPPGLLQIHRPLPPAPPAPTLTPSLPLVSCIMPTRDRPAFMLQSIHYFQRQDYPNRELIIMDDGLSDLTRLLPDDPRIRYQRLPSGQSIGAKRNQACELARGSLIAQWDDDDWYAPGRLSAQVAPLLTGAADISALPTGLFFDLARWEFWRCTPELHRRLFVEDVHGGTLVFRRHVWQHLAPYPDLSLAEDAAMLSRALQRGARLASVANDGLFIYLRHAGNSWSFACGQHLDPAGWRRVDEPALPPADRAFYAAHAPALLEARQRAAVQPGDSRPLVSCIMPTADRRAFAAQAIRHFQRQDYPNRELIVLDDGADPIDDLVPADPAIRYLRLTGRRSLGAKRNLACQAARGEFIAHWDDDDWSAPWRLSYQVAALREQQADACGLNELLYLDLTADRAWRYRYPPDSRAWVTGGTLCYTRELWSRAPFPEIDVGEDTYFLWSEQPKRIVMLDDNTFYVALIHAANTSPKATDSAWWRPCSMDEIWRLLGDDHHAYRLLAERLRPEAASRAS